MRALTRHEAKVCFKLWRKGCFGDGHMLLDNVVRGFPSHELAEVRGAVDDLIRAGVLVSKATKHGMAVYINPNKRFRVYDGIRAHPEFAWLPK